MNREAASQFIAGTLAGWMGFTYVELPSVTKRGKRKPTAAERDVLDRFGENVLLAWDVAQDELARLS